MNTCKLDYPAFFKILQPYYSFYQVIHLWKTYQNNEESFFNKIGPTQKELILQKITIKETESLAF